MANKIIEEYKRKREKELKEHPERFKPQWPYELFGVECGEGWKHLYEPITEYIENYNKTHEDEPIEIHQIKEKFGGLRYYTNFCTEELRKMIDKAEKESFKTCEVCGKHIDKPIIENRWVYAECNECHNERLQRRKKAFEEFKRKVEEHRNEESVHKSQEGEATGD